MSRLFKSPRSYNSTTGNITMSHSEFDNCLSGFTSELLINGENGPFKKEIEQWMLDSAVDMGDYMLMPFSPNSFLVKNV